MQKYIKMIVVKDIIKNKIIFNVIILNIIYNNKLENMEGTAKEVLINNVKDWVKLDNEISRLKLELKEKNNNKKLITHNLMDIMKTNNIDCFDIKDGALVYKKTKIKKPVNGKMLLETLKKFYGNDTGDLAEKVASFVMDNRDEVIKETIKRK